MMQVKGSAVQSLPSFIKWKFGDDSYIKWLHSLPQETKEEFRNILPSRWYPLNEILVIPTAKCCELFYNGSLTGAVEQGRYSAELALKGIYKFFIRFGSVDFIVSKASTILPTYYNPSAMEVVEKKDKELLLRITKFDSPHTIVEHRIKGWMEKALQLSGTKSPSVTIKSSMAKGSRFTDFVVTWL